MSTEHPDYEDGLAVQEATPKLAKPPLFKVILLNDDYTPMEFVVLVLEKFFRLDRSGLADAGRRSRDRNDDQRRAQPGRDFRSPAQHRSGTVLVEHGAEPVA